MRRYNFRKPRRDVGLSEQVGPISISNSREGHQKDDLQQQQQSPLHQEEHTLEHILKKVLFPIRSAQREQVGKQWLQIYVGRKCVFIGMM